MFINEIDKRMYYNNQNGDMLRMNVDLDGLRKSLIVMNLTTKATRVFFLGYVDEMKMAQNFLNTCVVSQQQDILFPIEKLTNWSLVEMFKVGQDRYRYVFERNDYIRVGFDKGVKDINTEGCVDFYIRSESLTIKELEIIIETAKEFARRYKL